MPNPEFIWGRPRNHDFLSLMLQTTPSTIKYSSVEMYAAMVAAEEKKATVPVCLHLDHGSSYELAVKCLENGYTFVMIDGSKEDLEVTDAVKKLIEKDPSVFDPKAFGKVGMSAVKELVKGRMKVCGCDGKEEQLAIRLKS